MQGEIEIDESYFFASLHSQLQAEGMLKRNGQVYTQIVKNCSTNELLPILSNFAELESSTIYSNTWKAYNGLVDFGAKAHYRVKHSKNKFALGKNHINGIENFFCFVSLATASRRGYAKHKIKQI